MGHILWTLAGAAAVGGAIGLTALTHQEPEITEAVTVSAPETAIVAERPFVESVGSSGSALATAAFGLSALQPDTYNGELVLEIIDASPLDTHEKESLAADLAAAEAGRADLDDVLQDVRIALAVE